MKAVYFQGFWNSCFPVSAFFFFQLFIYLVIFLWFQQGCSCSSAHSLHVLIYLWESSVLTLINYSQQKLPEYLGQKNKKSQFCAVASLMRKLSYQTAALYALACRFINNKIQKINTSLDSVNKQWEHLWPLQCIILCLVAIKTLPSISLSV